MINRPWHQKNASFENNNFMKVHTPWTRDNMLKLNADRSYMCWDIVISTITYFTLLTVVTILLHINYMYCTQKISIIERVDSSLYCFY